MSERPTPPNFIGMELDKAVRRCINSVPGGDWYIRVLKRDGMYKVVTKDYRTDRINVEVEQGVIINQHVG